MKKKILVTINTDGSHEIEAVGFSGTSCTKTTKALEDMLGSVDNRKFKPEYQAVQVENQTVRRHITL